MRYRFIHHQPSMLFAARLVSTEDAASYRRSMSTKYQPPPARARGDNGCQHVVTGMGYTSTGLICMKCGILMCLSDIDTLPSNNQMNMIIKGGWVVKGRTSYNRKRILRAMIHATKDDKLGAATSESRKPSPIHRTGGNDEERGSRMIPTPRRPKKTTATKRHPVYPTQKEQQQTQSAPPAVTHPLAIPKRRKVVDTYGETLRVQTMNMHPIIQKHFIYIHPSIITQMDRLLQDVLCDTRLSGWMKAPTKTIVYGAKGVSLAFACAESVAKTVTADHGQEAMKGIETFTESVPHMSSRLQKACFFVLMYKKTSTQQQHDNSCWAVHPLTLLTVSWCRRLW